MTTAERLEVAFRSADAALALRSSVKELFQEGCTKEEICLLLEEFVLRLRRRPGYRHAEEDVVLDILDSLTGFCHADAQLLSDDAPAEREGRRAKHTA